MVDTGPLLPLVTDNSRVRAVAANKPNTPGLQMGYQLVYEFESLEGPGFALVEPLGDEVQDTVSESGWYRIFFSTGSAADNKLA